MDLDTDQLLDVIDRFCDTAPRATASAEAVGPFTVFVARTGWPFYARPRLGLPIGAAIAADQVREVFARQRSLGVPLSLEWIHDRTPCLLAAVVEAGATCARRPLLVRTSSSPAPAPDGVSVMMLGPEDPRFESARATVSAGFGETDDLSPEPMLDTIRTRAVDGHIRVCGAFDADGTPLGGGTSVPRGDVSELTGIAVLPRHRRRGVGRALTYALAEDAHARGASTIWLSATNETVARVYEHAGFTRIGTSCEAELPGDLPAS